MIFIPIWITNILFLATCVLAGYQHNRLQRENPITNLQFVTMVFSLAMVVVLVVSKGFNPWMSVVFFLAAASVLLMTLRQQRMLPPNKLFE